MEKYYQYSFEEFCDDTYFLRFVKGEDIKCNNDWENWVTTTPSNIDAFKNAKLYLEQVIHPISIDIDYQLQEDNFKIIESKIRGTQKRNRRKAVIYSIVSLAAIITGLLIGLRWYLNDLITIQTSYGETTMITLPDSTHIELNSNTKLSYHRSWKWTNKREVWINGEAYLSVNHINKNPKEILPKERFKVFAGTSTIEVLGTEFNVRNRNQNTLVSLIKGHILFSDIRFKNKSIELQPGDNAIANSNKIDQIPKDKIKSVPQAWTKKEIISQGLTIENIINYYEELYGKKIIVSDLNILNKKIDGSISLNNPSIALYTIANLLNADVTIKGNDIYLTINY
ncbi:FecR family protein [Rhizosphaericola mali]|uniref:FecR family protein n=1 Tax=Rhizosphaericola mali TaxID=2545455 RepID=A0A5P2G3G9_9BACT|nr:FecR family protein [Rhizosphaericola mali]QES88362.1 FecR family protein [Rhizosphaericola mali]